MDVESMTTNDWLGVFFAVFVFGAMIYVYFLVLRPANKDKFESLRGMALDSLVSSGCIVSGARVSGSVLFTKVRVAEYSLIEDSVLLPEVVVGRNVILKRAVVDNGCIIPDGFRAGVNPDADRTRFHVTPRGITLITPEMLGQLTHRAA